MDKAKLEPCPICGGPASVFPLSTWQSRRFIASCDKGCVTQPAPSEKDEAIRKWNERPNSRLLLDGVFASYTFAAERLLAAVWEAVKLGHLGSRTPTGDAALDLEQSTDRGVILEALPTKVRQRVEALRREGA